MVTAVRIDYLFDVIFGLSAVHL